LLVSVAPQRVRTAALAVDAAELAMMERDDEPTQLAYAQALADWGDAGGCTAQGGWGVVGGQALGPPRGRARWGARRARARGRRADAVRGRAEARRPRGAAARPGRGAPARRARQLPGRAGQAMARGGARRVAQDRALRQPRPGAAGPDGGPRRDGRGRHGVDA